jgi:hypothetical protein
MAQAVLKATQLGLAGETRQGTSDRRVLFEDWTYTTTPGEFLTLQLRSNLMLELRRWQAVLHRGDLRLQHALGDSITMSVAHGLELEEALTGAFYIGFDLPKLDPRFRKTVTEISEAAPARLRQRRTKRASV